MKAIRNKGLLLEKDVFKILEVFSDPRAAQDFLEQIERISGQKMITKSVLNKNVEYVKSFVGGLGEDKNSVEKTFVKLGISLEVRHEKSESAPDTEKFVPKNKILRFFMLTLGPIRNLKSKISRHTFVHGLALCREYLCLDLNYKII